MYDLGDIVEMKKVYLCGVNCWEIIWMGVDIKIKCMGCGYVVMMLCCEFNKKFKKVLESKVD